MVRGLVEIHDIAGIGRETGRRLEVFFPGRPDPVLLPMSQIDFTPGRVVLPVWLADRFRDYLQPQPTGGPEQ